MMENLKVTETRKIHIARTRALKDILRDIEPEKLDRLFWHPNEKEYHKAIPINCAFIESEDIINRLDSIEEKHSDGYVTYKHHTHENGDHVIHKLNIQFHETGYQELKDKGVLY